MTTTMTRPTTQNVQEAKRRGVEVRKILTPAKLRRERAMLILATHRFLCTPAEMNFETQRFRWRDDLAPPVLGDGCVCRGEPMKVVR